MEKITSDYIKDLYNKTTRDEGVFGLTDHSGIQIVRKYKSNKNFLKNKRMFIKFVVNKNIQNLPIFGGVDMVIKSETTDGWTLTSPPGKLFQKYTPYMFNKQEDITFNPEKNGVNFKGKVYSINNFIEILEKNHERDMFLLSRVVSYLKLGLLHLIFILSDSKYDRIKHLFVNRENIYGAIPQNPNEQPPKKPDPFFRYFEIYKNLLGFTIILLLYPTFKLSTKNPYEYFTITNIFFLLLGFTLLFALEWISQFLLHLREGDFIMKTTKSTFENKGKLKTFRDVSSF